MIPLVRSPLQLYKKELEKLALFEKERIASWVFTEIKEKFLKNEIPWGSIPEKNESTQWISLPKATLRHSSRPKKIPCFFRIRTQGEKITPPHQKVRQIYIDILLDKSIYTYRMILLLSERIEK